MIEEKKRYGDESVLCFVRFLASKAVNKVEKVVQKPLKLCVVKIFLSNFVSAQFS